MNYPTNTWQELGWSETSGSNDFWEFCENVTNTNPTSDIKAIDSALAKYTDGKEWTNLGNYANYIKNAILPICEDGDYNNSNCFGTQNGEFDWLLLKFNGIADIWEKHIGLIPTTLEYDHTYTVVSMLSLYLQTLTHFAKLALKVELTKLLSHLDHRSYQESFKRITRMQQYHFRKIFQR